jgi:protein TonB
MDGSMRENYLGAVISILVHSCIILLLAAASFAVQNRPTEVLEIDFSLMEDPAKGSLPKVEKEIIEKKPRILKGATRPKRIVEPDRVVKENPETIAAKEPVAPPSDPTIAASSAPDLPEELVERQSIPTVVTASDAQGETVVHGTPATYTGSSGSVSALQRHGGSAGGTNGAEGGDGGAVNGGETVLGEGKDYTYIRHAVMKNIGYPERARRMGFEGKTLLSFMVLENGTTSQIKVEKSSGYRLLDDSAVEGVARTVISQKVSYRVVVRLPITYRLQVSKGDGTDMNVAHSTKAAEGR